ncbi:hypothetical protein ACHWQZ_G013836 [Mnemiopsis leidyi]
MADEGQQMKTIVGHNIVVFFTFFLIIFTTAVQIFLIQAEIGLMGLFLPPTMLFGSMMVINYWKCVKIDSSSKSVGKPPSVQTDGWRYCPYTGCSGSVPVNSRHCHQCNVCVIQRDHHCHFTANCIGQNTLPFFMVLILSMFGLTLTYCFANIIYITTHETPGTLILTVVAPIQVLWYFLGYVTLSHCLISLNIVISFGALMGSIVLNYHEYNLLFHNKPYLTKSMPIASSGVLKMSKLDRIKEVYGKKWYMFFIDPTHQSAIQKQFGVTKVM